MQRNASVDRGIEARLSRSFAFETEVLKYFSRYETIFAMATGRLNGSASDTRRSIL